MEYGELNKNDLDNTNMQLFIDQIKMASITYKILILQHFSNKYNVNQIIAKVVNQPYQASRFLTTEQSKASDEMIDPQVWAGQYYYPQIWAGQYYYPQELYDKLIINNILI